MESCRCPVDIARVVAVSLGLLPLPARPQSPRGFIESDQWACLLPLEGADCSAGGLEAMAANWVAPHDVSRESPVLGTVWADIDFAGAAKSRSWRGAGVPRFVPIGRGSNPDVVDFGEYLAARGLTEDWVLALAVTYVENLTGEPLPVGLCTASDDSIQVWVNQQRVVHLSVCRALAADCAEIHPAVLAPGVNRITVLVWDGFGGFGFRLGLTREDGTKYTDAAWELAFLGAEDASRVVSPPPLLTRAFDGARHLCPRPRHEVILEGGGFAPGTLYEVVEEIVSPRLTPGNVSDVSQGGRVEVLPPLPLPPPRPVGVFADHRVVGGPPCLGGSDTSFDGRQYRSASETGGDIWENGDTFEFAYSRFEGDFDIAIAFTDRSHSSGTGRWGKFGLMARWSLSATSRYTMIQDHLPDLEDPARLAGRTAHDLAVPTGNMFEDEAPPEEVSAHPRCLRLVRRGDIVEGWASDAVDLWAGRSDPADDANWVRVGRRDDWGWEAPERAYVGFANSEHWSGSCATQTVTFRLLNLTGQEVALDSETPRGARISWRVPGSVLAGQGLRYRVAAPPGLSARLEGRAGAAVTAGPGRLHFQTWGSRGVGIFAEAHDIGEQGPCMPGSTVYDPATGTYTMAASGTDIWQNGDQFHFAHLEVEGDFSAEVHFSSVTPAPAGSRWGKYGLMARWDCRPRASYFFVHNATASDMSCEVDGPRVASRAETTLAGATQESNWIYWQDVFGDEPIDPWRCAFPVADGRLNDVRGDRRNAPRWLRLVRRGNTFYGYGSDDGENWRTLGSTTRPEVPRSLLVGVASTSHADCGVQEINFDAFSVEPPPPLELTTRREAGPDELEGTWVASARFDTAEGWCPPGWQCQRSGGDLLAPFSPQVAGGRLRLGEIHRSSLGEGGDMAAAAFLETPFPARGAYLVDLDVFFRFDQDADGGQAPGDGLALAFLGVAPVERRDLAEAAERVDTIFKRRTIGSPCRDGNWTTARGEGLYTTRAATGRDIWADGDVFEFAYSALQGDFDLAVELQERRLPARGRWGKFGLMARQSLAGTSRYAMIQDHGPDLQDVARFARRIRHLEVASVEEPATAGGFLRDPNDGTLLAHPRFLRLTRRGDQVSGWVSNTAGDREPADDGNWRRIFADGWSGAPGVLFAGFAFSTHHSSGCEGGEVDWALLHFAGTRVPEPELPADPYGLDVRLGGAGSGLGYDRINNSRSEYTVVSKALSLNSFALEFDTWHGSEVENDGDGANVSGWDPAGGPAGTGTGAYHVALDAGGSVWSAQRNQEAGTHDDDLPDLFAPAGVHLRLLYDHGLVRAWVRPGGPGDAEWRQVTDYEIEPLHVNAGEFLLALTAGTGEAACTMEVDNLELRKVELRERFVRGDADASGRINITDGVVVLNGLFRGHTVACLDAGDVDDSGDLNLTDAVRLFGWLFRGGAVPAAPSPTRADYSREDCGSDPAPDDLDCAQVAPKCPR